MAKRFIDTEIFEDSWFMELSVEAKLLYIYFITNCDHAGIIDINWKLVEFQTGIKELGKSYDTLMKELGKSILRLKSDRNYFFIPKFIDFQYPGFPKSKVRQQDGAIKRLKEFGLWDDQNLRVRKELVNSYGNDNGNDNVKGGVGENLPPRSLPSSDLFLSFFDAYKKITGNPNEEEAAKREFAVLTQEERGKAMLKIQDYYDDCVRNKRQVKLARYYLKDKSFNNDFTIRHEYGEPRSQYDITHEHIIRQMAEKGLDEFGNPLKKDN